MTYVPPDYALFHEAQVFLAEQYPHVSGTIGLTDGSGDFLSWNHSARELRYGRSFGGFGLVTQMSAEQRFAAANELHRLRDKLDAERERIGHVPKQTADLVRQILDQWKAGNT